MKTIFTILSLCLCLVGFSQTPKLYIGITSHNEMTNTGSDAEPYDSDASFYYKTKDTLMKIADMIYTLGAKYNLQTCQRFVYASHLHQAAGSPTMTTDPLEYCYKLGGMPYGNVVEIDPRTKTAAGNIVSPINHTLNIADVAHIIDSTGAKASKTLGGFLYKTTNTNWTGDWMPYTTTITGTYNKPWKADIMWGAGSTIMPIHSQDANNYGLWKPRGNADSIDFYCHSPAQTFWVEGNGCGWNLAPTGTGTIIPMSTVYSLIADIRSEATKIANGTFPANKFYNATVMINFKHFQIPGFRKQLTEVVDSINKMVTEGKIVWATINQKLTAFKTWTVTSGLAYSQWRCGQTATLAPTCALSSVTEFDKDDGFLKVYPNPASNELTYEFQSLTGRETYFYVYDNLGRMIIKEPITESVGKIELDNLPSGLYLIQATNTRPKKLLITK